MKLSAVKSSVRNVQQGAWVKDLPIQGLEGVALKVRGINNPDAVRLRGELVANLPEERRAVLIEADRDAIGNEIMVRAILLDWNLEDDDGAMACTEDAVRAILADPDMGAEMARAIAYAASVVGAQGLQSLEAATKN